MKRVLSYILAIVTVTTVFYSCSLTNRLNKKRPVVELSQTDAKQSQKPDTMKVPKFITFTDKDGRQKIVTEAILDSVTGEHITNIQLEEIKVVAKSKNIPERNGNINVEFVVTVPAILINKRWALTLTPELIKGDTILKLNELVLSGRKFRKQQLKDYQKYERFLESIIPDSVSFSENYVDMAGVRNYMDRKSVEQSRKQEKELRRELSRISFARNAERRKQLERERELIIRNAKKNPAAKIQQAVTETNQEEPIRNVSESRRKVATDYPDFSRMQVKEGATGTKETVIEDVTTYLQDLSVTESQMKEEKENNVIFTNMNQMDKETSYIIAGKVAFTPQDSAKVMEQFVLKDKLEKNERKKMQKEQKYEELVRHPYNEDARIDSIVNTGGTFRYFYSQPVPADEHTKKMMLTLSGRVDAIDNSTFQLHMNDTITYYVSSMVQFLDRAPRFRKKIIERRAEANLSAYINFPVGKDIVDESIGDNEKEINKIYDMIKKLTWSSEFEIDSITMTASSSPEGGFYANQELAKRRACSLKKFFATKLDDKQGVDTLLNARWIAEDWEKLKGFVVNDEQIENRDGLLGIIDNVKSPDSRESKIRSQFKKEYEYLKSEIYPKLRVVDFKFNLHRAGMVKDTIHTTEPDTEYADAIKMLEDRKYKQALSILIDYDDFNTAICYMSLGYDETAYKILAKEPETSDSKYLLAVLSARLGNDSEAVRCYLRSVELDDAKAWRGLLDPEVNRLIKAYDLNKEESTN